MWGTLHGLAQVFNRLFKKTWDRCNQVFQWLCTFAFVNVMWLIFRADNVKQAIKTISRMLRMESYDISAQLCNCFKLEEVDWIVQHIKPLSVFQDKIYGFYMWTTLLGALFICLNFMSFAGVSMFLYFNF